MASKLATQLVQLVRTLCTAQHCYPKSNNELSKVLKSALGCCLKLINRCIFMPKYWWHSIRTWRYKPGAHYPDFEPGNNFLLQVTIQNS